MNRIKKINKKINKSKKLKTLISAMLLITIAGGVFYFIKTKDKVFTDSAIISAPIINIAPDSASKLLNIDVYEGEKVKKGDEIAVFDSQTVKAYTDGIIIKTNNQIGAVMSTQTPVVQMIDPADMKVVATIDENKGLDKIKIGQPASFTVDALPGKTFWGYVDEVAPSAKQTQMAFSISSERPVQQFEVYIKFDSNSYPEIKNGMSAKVTVYTKSN